MAKPAATLVDKTSQEQAGLLEEPGSGGLLRRSSGATPASPSHHLSPHAVYQSVTARIESVMRGQSVAIRRLMAALASGGHVLLEDYPGDGQNDSGQGSGAVH